jgi:hypothetical protein
MKGWMRTAQKNVAAKEASCATVCLLRALGFIARTKWLFFRQTSGTLAAIVIYVCSLVTTMVGMHAKLDIHASYSRCGLSELQDIGH